MDLVLKSFLAVKNELELTKIDLMLAKMELAESKNETAKGIEEITKVKNQLKTVEDKLARVGTEPNEKVQKHDESHTITLLDVTQKTAFDPSNTPGQIFNSITFYEEVPGYDWMIKTLLLKMTEGQIYYPSNNEVIFKLLVKDVDHVDQFYIDHWSDFEDLRGEQLLQNESMALIQIRRDYYQLFLNIETFERGNSKIYLHRMQEQDKNYFLKYRNNEQNIPWSKYRNNNENNEVLFHMTKE